MPTKKLTKKQMKDEDPLVMYPASEPFFKAFVFPTDDSEMVVDTGGDIFSVDPPSAVKQLFDEMDQDLMTRIPNVDLIDDKGNPIENQATADEHLGRIMLIRMVMNWNEEFKKIRTKVSNEYMIMELKDSKEGYQIRMQDYNLTSVTLKMDPDTKKFKLAAFNAVAMDLDNCISEMPESFGIT